MDGSALVQSAQAALGAGDVEAALGHLREAVAAGPDPLARELLGGLLFFDDDLVGARRELELAFREWKDAGQARAAALVAAALADLHSSGFGHRVVGQGWVARARRLLAAEGRCVEQGYVELAVIACETDDVSRLEEATQVALDLAAEFGDPELEGGRWPTAGSRSWFGAAPGRGSPVSTRPWRRSPRARCATPRCWG
jgi:hypothetical protein